MGIFDFLKKKEEKPKPTLLSDIKTASEWIINALNYSGYNVSMSIDSLKEVDRFFNEQLDDDSHSPIQGGLLSESMGQRLFALGSFIGEVIINEYGGEWITDDNDKNGEINISVQLPNGSVIWPVQRVIKRCKEGPENDIYNYAVLSNR
jgi:hypothetical protein